MKQATIHTDFGTMTLRFFPDVAPGHVENFLSLAQEGFYDGRTFHRIMRGFMIQGGCPEGTGMGSGPRRLKAEFNDRPHQVGTLSMARSANPDSASCQFFICLARCDFLDGQYTAFGELVDDASRATLQKIGDLPVKRGDSGESSTPVTPVKMNKITVEEVPD
jgi:peptidyl-prolyl cis-trans isomerase B (cyclophilin B)